MTKFMNPTDIGEKMDLLFANGSVKVLQRLKIVDAIRNNEYEDFQDFLDEAVFECWIEDYPEETA